MLCKEEVVQEDRSVLVSSRKGGGYIGLSAADLGGEPAVTGGMVIKQISLWHRHCFIRPHSLQTNVPN